MATPNLPVLLFVFSLITTLTGCKAISSDSANTSTPPKVLLVTVAAAPEATLDRLQQSLASDYQLKPTNNWPLHSLDIYCFIYHLPDVADTERLITEIELDPRVDSAQLVRQFDILENQENPSVGESSLDYDDQHYALQIGLRAMQADKAHQWATGKSVKVGVIDTGIDAHHNDLISVSYTRSFVGDASDNLYPENHGTAIAGVIAAKANNAIGIVGIAPDAEIIGLRGCWQPEGTTRGSCNSLSLAKAIDYANINNIDILNLSLQGPYDPIIERLLNVAINQNTIVITAYQPSTDHFPASMANVIAVTSDSSLIDDNALESTLVAAPGHDILTTIPASQYDLLDGSSLAAAHVTGVVALMRETQPELTVEKISAVLTAYTIDGEADHSGGMMVNACKAISALADNQHPQDLC